MSTRVRNHLQGVVFLVVIALLGWLAIAVYQKAFTTVADVTLRTDRVGNQLKVGADVKVRGVVVGEVRQVAVTGSGVDVHLALLPQALPELPRNTTARLLPKTLFGQRYVSLVLPGQPDRARLAPGDVISQDRGATAIELEQALRDLMPVLQAVQPQKLSSSLGAIAQALENRGKPLGETLVSLNSYLDQLNPHLPQLQDDITRFADTVAAYQQAGPDIVDALAGLTTTSKTLADQKQNLADLFSTMTTASEDLDKFLKANQNNLIRLSADSRPTMELIGRYAPELPCLLSAVNALRPTIEKALGAGSDLPGLHVVLEIKESRGPYLPGRDNPTFTATGGPKCYPTPTGGGGGGLGLPNSPQESAFLSELLAPALGTDPARVPDWSGLLVGPLLRGAEVEFK